MIIDYFYFTIFPCVGKTYINVLDRSMKTQYLLNLTIKLRIEMENVHVKETTT